MFRLERRELIEIQDVTDYHMAPTTSVTKIAQQDPRRVKRALRSFSVRGRRML